VGTKEVISESKRGFPEFAKSVKNRNRKVISKKNAKKVTVSVTVAAKGPHLYDLFFFLMFFCTLFGYIILRISMYEGWRHAYSLFCPLLYISVYGLNRAYLFFKGKAAALRLGFVCAIALCLTAQFAWIVANHPYQYVYFNTFGKLIAEKNFTLDYWDVSHMDLIRYALKDTDKEHIIINDTNRPVKNEFLTESEKARVTLAANDPAADYYIQHTRMDYNRRHHNAGYEELTAITVDGMKISTLFKRVIPEAEYDYNALGKVAEFTSNRNQDNFAGMSDGDAESRWSTGRPQRPGDYMVLRFNEPVAYDFISLILTANLGDFSGDLTIEVSDDALVWEVVPYTVTGQCHYKFNSKPEPYKYLRLTNNYSGITNWSVYEMNLGYAKSS
jgi:hypothetical protein